MNDYESLARRVLGCESRERRGRLWCETHDEPWECPRATEVADELREAWRAEADALLERLAVAERRAESLAALLADVAASAWDEGFAAGVNTDMGDYEHPPEVYTNPYRTGADQ